MSLWNKSICDYPHKTPRILGSLAFLDGGCGSWGGIRGTWEMHCAMDMCSGQGLRQFKPVNQDREQTNPLLWWTRPSFTGSPEKEAIIWRGQRRFEYTFTYVTHCHRWQCIFRGWGGWIWGRRNHVLFPTPRASRLPTLSILFPLSREILVSRLSPPCYLIPLGLEIVVWLSLTLQLTST